MRPSSNSFVAQVQHFKAELSAFQSLPVQGDEAGSHGRFAEAGVLSRAVRATLARLSYRLPVRIICISRWLRDRIGQPGARVVAQGLDLATFAPRREDGGVQVVVGTK